MYIKTLIFAAITLVFTSFPAFAATPQVHQLRTMTSAPGQSKVAFLVGVAYWMRAWTDQQGYEVCGMIGRDGSTYSVVATTSNSRVACLAMKTKIVEGAVSTGVTIHTHVRPGGAYSSKEDMAFMHIRNKLWVSVRERAGSNFSAKDYRSGCAGYLVGYTSLYFQHGKGTQVEVASITRPLLANQ